jgi:SAM-dependent methyltransferase
MGATGNPDVGPFRRGWRRLLNAAARGRGIAYHYLDAVVPRTTVWTALREYRRYLRERDEYVALSGERLDRYDDAPQLLDRTGTSLVDPHYTHQDAWASRELYRRRPARHVDVGSRITFLLGIAAFVRVTFLDLRPLEADIPGIDSRAGSILDLPYESCSVESLSCLHVAEHIGLGRYGDPLDPRGTEKAAAELARVLAPGGTLYFSLPVGRKRTAFNAHRVHDPREVPSLFGDLTLEAFAGVDDSGAFREGIEPEDLAGCEWGCGFYVFSRPAPIQAG